MLCNSLIFLLLLLINLVILVNKNSKNIREYCIICASLVEYAVLRYVASIKCYDLLCDSMSPMRLWSHWHLHAINGIQHTHYQYNLRDFSYTYRHTTKCWHFYIFFKVFVITKEICTTIICWYFLILNLLKWRLTKYVINIWKTWCNFYLTLCKYL